MKRILFMVAFCSALSAFSIVFAADESSLKFSLPRIDGKTVNVGALIGKKIVVLDFWASWCPSCKKQIPELENLRSMTGADKAAFFSINTGENAIKAKNFMEETDFSYEVLIDENKNVAKQLGVKGIPSIIIIGLDGKIIFRGSRPPKNFTFK